jgi:hypothetical protein
VNTQPPPTWAPITLKDSITGESNFNPIWLQYFINLGANSSASFATQAPVGGFSSSTTTSSPYTTVVTRLTTLVFGGTITSVQISRGGASITWPPTVPVELSPGDGVDVIFTGILEVEVVPR